MLYWYEQDKTTAVIKFYGTIEWWYNNASAITGLSEALDTKYKNITYRVHCYGGNVMEGNATYNCIAGLNAFTLWIIEGICASMGTIVMLPCDEIEICENALIMIHEPSGGAYGNERDMRSAADLLKIMKKNAGNAYAKKMGTSLADIQATYFDGADHWISAEEALNLGLVNRVIPAVVKNVKAITIPEPGDEGLENDVPVDASAIYNRYAALLEMKMDGEQEFKPGMEIKKPAKKAPKAQAKPQDTLKSDINMKKALIAQYQLQGVDENTPDDQFMPVLNAAIAKLGQPTAPAQPAAPAADASKAAAAESVLKTLEDVTGHPYEASQRAVLLNVGATAGTEAMVMVIKSLKAAPVAQGENPAPAPPRILDLGGNGPSASGSKKDWNWNMWQKEDPRGLEAMEKSNPALYKQLYKAEYGVDIDL